MCIDLFFFSGHVLLFNYLFGLFDDTAIALNF